MESQTVLKNGKEISLTSKEFSLLYLFIENPEYIFFQTGAVLQGLEK